MKKKKVKKPEDLSKAEIPKEDSSKSNESQDVQKQAPETSVNPDKTSNEEEGTSKIETATVNVQKCVTIPPVQSGGFL